MSEATETNDAATHGCMDSPGLRAPDVPLLEQLRSKTARGNLEFEISGVDFSGLDLEGANFDSARLDGCVFERSNLTRALFTNTVIEDTSFVGASVGQAKFTDAELLQVDFSEANLEAADFRGANLEEINVARAVLRGSVFEYGDVNLLDAADVKDMDITAVDDDSMEPRERLTLYQRGARAHSGIRCPRCAQWDGYDQGLEPNCPRCWGVGFVDPDDAGDEVDDDEEEETDGGLMPCPWCHGSGSQTGAMSTWACPVCDGDGDVELWAVDLHQVREHIDGNDWENIEASGFPRMNVKNVDFEYESFSGGHFENVVFEMCDFRFASFDQMVLKNVQFVGYSLRAGDFSGAQLTNVQFELGDLEMSKWTGAVAVNVLVDDEPVPSATDVLTVWNNIAVKKRLGSRRS